MRARNVAIAGVAGLALAAGLAVGGDAGGAGGAPAGPSGPVRPEPAGDALRVAGPLIGRTARDTATTADAGFRRMATVKTRATRGTLRVVQRTPAGGDRLPWALRSFERPRVTGGLASRVRADPTRPGIRCVQLGRLRGSTFGWVLPGGPFRPSAATTDLLAVCETDATSARPGVGALVLPDRDPYDPDSRARESVVWGLAPRGATRVEVRWAGWTRTVAVRQGTYLVVGPAPRGPFVGPRATVSVPGARTPPARPAPAGRPRAYAPATARDPRIVARLVDPTTGRPVVAIVGTAGGRPCDGGTQPLAAGVVGQVDAITRTITGGGQGCQVVPIPKRGAAPMLIGYGGGTGPTEGPDLVARQRLVPGSFGVTVLTPPDVVRVELRTPVDVRTVRAVAPGIVHALYDGSAFQSGGLSGSPSIDVVGVRADGSTIRGAGAPSRVPVRLGSAELGGR